MTHRKKLQISQQKKKSSKTTVRKRKSSTNEVSEPKLSKCEQKEEIITINDLNDDCLERIFKKLSIKDRCKLSQVCKRWKEAKSITWSDVKQLNLSENEDWSHLDELPPEYHIEENIQDLLTKCGRFLRELIIGDPYSYKVLNVVAEECRNLDKLILDFDDYGRKFTDFFLKFENLKYFGMKRIKHVLRDDFWGIPSKSVEEFYLGAAGHSIVNFKLSNLTGFTNISTLTLSYFYIMQSMLSTITVLPGLRHLTFEKCKIICKSFDCLLQLENLERLSFIEASGLTYKSLRELIWEHKALKYLYISNCGEITETMILALREMERVDVASNFDEPSPKLNVSREVLAEWARYEQEISLESDEQSCIETDSNSNYSYSDNENSDFDL